ncbi:hypothetical protein [Mucilaginibacter sp. CSA2-8R]|uniref:hypothetical protein n=1 Tax=Mucilaginibacter sp. CSA2-8R TaxID=3141542 RepID=UPI00315D02A7
MTNTLQAGVAKVDITPPLGTLINGDFVTHYATQIHDVLYAKALVFKGGGVTVALCIVDICAMRRELLDAVKAQVYELTDILPPNILISSTHTHASGSVESLLLGAADLPYRQKLPSLIVEAIVKAQQNLVNARVGFGSVNIPEYVLCRRYAMQPGYEAQNPVTGGLDRVKTNPFGAEDQIIGPVSQMDTELCYLAVKNENDEWLGLLGNYSMHYVGDWENGTLSSDYFGEFSNQLKDLLHAGDAFVGMLSNGTSGEANIWDFLNPGRFPKGNYEKSRLIGGDLAKRVAQSVNEIEWQANATIAADYAEVRAGIRKPDASELEAAKLLVAQGTYEKLDGIDFKTMQRLYAREQVLLNEFPDQINFPVQAIKIGNVVIGALGGEFFAETGLALKSEIKNYFTITLANDYVGYVCPEHEIERGGYETWRCRTSCLEVTAEEKIRQVLKSLINKF